MRFRFWFTCIASFVLLSACEQRAVEEKASALADSVTQEMMDQVLNPGGADTADNADNTAPQSPDSIRDKQKLRAAFRENLKRLKQELKENQE